MNAPILRLLVLKTDQLDAVVDFYSRLGCRFTAERHGDGPRHFAADMGEWVLEIYPLSKDDPPNATTRIGFAVGCDAIAAHPDLSALTFRESPWGRRAVARDPDGRAVELYLPSDEEAELADG